MEKQTAHVLEQQEANTDALVELADVQLAFVGGGIGDTAI